MGCGWNCRKGRLPPEHPTFRYSTDLPPKDDRCQLDGTRTFLKTYRDERKRLTYRFFRCERGHNLPRSSNSPTT